MKKLLLVTAITAALFSVEASAVVSATAIPLAAGKVDFSTATGIQNATAVPVKQILYVAGSSAAAGFLEAAVTNLAKDSSTVYKYYSTATKDILTYVLTAKSGVTGLTADHTYVIHYRNRDGSLMAALLAGSKSGAADKAPGSTVAASSPVKFNSVPGFVTNNSTYTCGAPAASLTAGVTITSCAGTTEVLATAPATAIVGGANATTSSTLGLSDVDAGQFASPLNGANAANQLGALAPVMGSNAIAAQVFGVAVTTGLRNAMQRAEILSGAIKYATDGTTLCTAGNEDEACMPSFTSEQISSIFATGRFNDWTNLGYAAGVNLVTANTGFLPSNKAVHICSRTAGSGTLATVNTIFENAPCSAVAEPVQTATSAVLAPLATNVANVNVLTGLQTVSGTEVLGATTKAYHANVGSGDVDTCLTTLANTAGAASMAPYATATSTADFRWAVGILNANRNNTGSKAYRFVKIDGYAPSNVNAANGKYRFWSELSYLTPATTSVLSDTAKALVTEMSKPETIKASGVNVATMNGFVTGYMATAANMTDTVYNLSLPVMPFTHADKAATLGSVNHCRAAAIQSGNKLLPGLN